MASDEHHIQSNSSKEDSKKIGMSRESKKYSCSITPINFFEVFMMKLQMLLS